ncbi:uncharacterized protein V6R79_021950 [Siganus canaliculatus]
MAAAMQRLHGAQDRQPRTKNHKFGLRHKGAKISLFARPTVDLCQVESVHSSRNEQRLRLPDFWEIWISGDRLQTLVPDPCEDAEFSPQRTKFARQRDVLSVALSERPAAEAHRTSRAPPKRPSATSASQQSNKP